MNINPLEFLKHLEERGELFSFIEDIFDIEPMVVQYKIVNDNLIINIFTNKNGNLFLAYIFLNEDNIDYCRKIIDIDCIVNYVYIKRCYEIAKVDTNNKLILFAASLKK